MAPAKHGCMRDVNRYLTRHPKLCARTCEAEEMSERERYLTKADELIAAANKRVSSIRAHIADLERDGRNASAARDVLERLEGKLELMHRKRDVIARLLDKRDRPNGASGPE